MIYNNIIPEKEYQELYNLITGPTFPWYYQPDIAFKNRDDYKNDKDVFSSWGLTHNVWDVNEGKVSEILSYMPVLVENFQLISGIKINHYLRIKINLQMPLVGFTANNYNGAHIDQFQPHKTLIYYLNDSDGDTFIFNEIYDPMLSYPLKNFTVKERISPKANSLYYLDNGFTYHSGSNPIISQRRITININFI